MKLVSMYFSFAVLGSLATAYPPADDGWIDLFSKLSWYQEQAGKEQILSGKLEAVPNAGRPSTLQRTTYYRLGERTVYTGAKKMEVLNKLLGKQVEIKGKGVEFNLEGQFLREIWPAAIREKAVADKN